MIESNLMHVWATLLGSLATIALVLMAFGIMLGMVKPAEAVRHCGAILGIIIVLMLGPGILLSAWLSISLWQRIAVLAIGICNWRWRQPRRKAGKKERQ